MSRIVSLDIEFMVDNSLLSALEKYSALSGPVVSGKRAAVPGVAIPIVAPFLCGSFNSSFFAYNFQTVIFDGFLGLFGFVLLGGESASCVGMCVVHQIWGTIPREGLFKSSFCPHLFSSPLKSHPCHEIPAVSLSH